MGSGGTSRGGVARVRLNAKRPAPRPVFLLSAHFTASNSTSNISVAFGGITPPAPRAP